MKKEQQVKEHIVIDNGVAHAITDEPKEPFLMEEYTVTINGIEHTMLLSPEDAERYGDEAKKATTSTKASTPANKARS